MRDYIAWLLERLPKEERDENGARALEVEFGPMPTEDFVADLSDGIGFAPSVAAPSHEDTLNTPAASLVADAHRVQAASPAGNPKRNAEVWSKRQLQNPAAPIPDAYRGAQRATAPHQASAPEDRMTMDLETLEGMRSRAALEAPEVRRNRPVLEVVNTARHTPLLEKRKPVRKQRALFNALESVRKRVDVVTQKMPLARTDLALRKTESERLDRIMPKSTLERTLRRAVGEEMVAQGKANLLLTRLQQQGRLARFALEGGRERVQAPLPTPLQPAWGTQTDLSTLDRAAERDARGYDKGFSLF